MICSSSALCSCSRLLATRLALSDWHLMCAAMARAECPRCGLYVCHLHVPACGEFLWHEPECEDLLSESEDYAVACAQCMEEASIAAKQRTVLCFRLCLPSSLDMRILTAVMSFLCVPRGLYKVQNRRYLLQALLMGHVYTCNDLYSCHLAMDMQMDTPIYRYGCLLHKYYPGCPVFRDSHVHLITYLVSFVY